ncbi:MAG: hypothetical protein R3A47_01180 [Polyangiales bacterium]
MEITPKDIQYACGRGTFVGVAEPSFSLSSMAAACSVLPTRRSSVPTMIEHDLKSSENSAPTTRILFGLAFDEQAGRTVEARRERASGGPADRIGIRDRLTRLGRLNLRCTILFRPNQAVPWTCKCNVKGSINRFTRRLTLRTPTAPSFRSCVFAFGRFGIYSPLSGLLVERFNVETCNGRVHQ